MTNIFLIGDVHGMSIELQALMDKLSPRSEDQVIFVGDLLDKGDDSVGVASLVRNMDENAAFEVILVEGNHEDKHRRFRRNKVLRPKVAAEQAARSPELNEITEELSANDIAFLDKAIPFYRIPKHDILVVHGGIPGDMSRFPNTIEEVERLTGKQRKRFLLIMRTRYLRPNGRFIFFGEESKTDSFWAETYDGRFGHVVFGHEPFMSGVGFFPHATGIDTGAVFGGRLTALKITNAGERSFVSVPSRKIAEPLKG
jgi:serine/threonine protein phosphatase 1